MSDNIGDQDWAAGVFWSQPSPIHPMAALNRNLTGWDVTGGANASALEAPMDLDFPPNRSDTSLDYPSTDSGYYGDPNYSGVFDRLAKWDIWLQGWFVQSGGKFPTNEEIRAFSHLIRLPIQAIRGRFEMYRQISEEPTASFNSTGENSYGTSSGQAPSDAMVSTPMTGQVDQTEYNSTNSGHASSESIVDISVIRQLYQSQQNGTNFMENVQYVGDDALETPFFPLPITLTSSFNTPSESRSLIASTEDCSSNSRKAGKVPLTDSLHICIHRICEIKRLRGCGRMRRNETPKGAYWCTLQKECRKRFRSPSDLKRHEAIVYPQRAFFCTLCGDLGNAQKSHVFFREDKICDHFNKYHPSVTVNDITEYEVPLVGLPFMEKCNFKSCDYIAPSWDERHSHLKAHFQSGTTMDDWQQEDTDDVDEHKDTSYQEPENEGPKKEDPEDEEPENAMCDSDDSDSDCTSDDGDDFDANDSGSESDSDGGDDENDGDNNSNGQGGSNDSHHDHQGQDYNSSHMPPSSDGRGGSGYQMYQCLMSNTAAGWYSGNNLLGKADNDTPLCKLENSTGDHQSNGLSRRVKEEVSEKGGFSIVRKFLTQPFHRTNPHMAPSDSDHKRCFAIKEVRNDHIASFQREVRALSMLRQEHLVTMLAWYSSTNPNGSPIHSLVLEYADFDMAAFFSNIPQPTDATNVAKHWNELRDLAGGLKSIHQVPLKGQVGRIYHGLHADIKPDNILRIGNKWKLADFGFSDFVLAEGDKPPTFKVAGGTATYSPPEAFRPDSSHPYFAPTQAFDIWCFGCVLSEFATWVVLGPRGHNAYRQLRREEMEDSKLPNCYSQTCLTMDCFHDGDQVLRSVSSTHRRVRECDVNHVHTVQVLDLVENNLLQSDPSMRLDATQLCDRLNEIMDKGKSTKYDEWTYTCVGSDSSESVTEGCRPRIIHFDRHISLSPPNNLRFTFHAKTWSDDIDILNPIELVVLDNDCTPSISAGTIPGLTTYPVIQSFELVRELANNSIRNRQHGMISPDSIFPSSVSVAWRSEVVKMGAIREPEHYKSDLTTYVDVVQFSNSEYIERTCIVFDPYISYDFGPYIWSDDLFTPDVEQRSNSNLLDRFQGWHSILAHSQDRQDLLSPRDVSTMHWLIELCLLHNLEAYIWDPSEHYLLHPVEGVVGSVFDVQKILHLHNTTRSPRFQCTSNGKCCCCYYCDSSGICYFRCSGTQLQLSDKHRICEKNTLILTPNSGTDSCPALLFSPGRYQSIMERIEGVLKSFQTDGDFIAWHKRGWLSE